MNISDAFPSKYLKTEDLRGRDVTVTIESVDLISLPNDQGRKLAIRFAGKDKQWIVNKTNANTIAKLLNSGVMEDWVGKSITLYPTETAYQGEMVDCIRVRRNKAADSWEEPPAPARQAMSGRQAEPEAPVDEYDDQVPF